MTTNARRPSEVRRALRDLHRLLDEKAPGYMPLADRAKAILDHLGDTAGNSGNGGSGSGGTGDHGERKQRQAARGASGGTGKAGGAARREASLRFGSRDRKPEGNSSPPSGKQDGGNGNGSADDIIKRFIDRLVGSK